MSDRSNPFQGLEELFERMSQQFENAARAWDVESQGPGRFDLSMGETTNGLDFADHGDEYVVTVDVPGYEKDDIEVRLSGDTLLVDGKREQTVDEDEENYLRRERRRRSFSRRVTVPEPVDTDGVSAQVTNGVLTITLPKSEPTDDSESIPIE
jgi:HSP20 family protein